MRFFQQAAKRLHQNEGLLTNLDSRTDPPVSAIADARGEGLHAS